MLREQLESSEEQLMRLQTHMSDLKRNHSNRLHEWEQRAAQVTSERDGLFVQREQVAGIVSVREELREYEAECAKLRRVPTGAGGLASGGVSARDQPLDPSNQSTASKVIHDSSHAGFAKGMRSSRNVAAGLSSHSNRTGGALVCGGGGHPGDPD